MNFAGAGIPSRKIGCRDLAGIVKIANALESYILECYIIMIHVAIYLYPYIRITSLLTALYNYTTMIM